MLPYQDYLRSTGDREEDARRRELVSEIIVQPEQADIRAFSYMSELASDDVALTTLTRILEAVRAIRRHGIVEGPWLERENWLGKQIARTWLERGAFPGMGSALEALGVRLGTPLVLELVRSDEAFARDPWAFVESLLEATRPCPSAFSADVAAAAKTWAALSDQRRALLRLLSRFALTPDQAERWFTPSIRAKAGLQGIVDAQILDNPYLIPERDLGDWNDLPVSIGAVDRGLLPDFAVANRFPVPAPSAVGSPQDARRIIQRAILSSGNTSACSPAPTTEPHGSGSKAGTPTTGSSLDGTSLRQLTTH